jgi:hypothetical protein
LFYRNFAANFIGYTLSAMKKILLSIVLIALAVSIAWANGSTKKYSKYLSESKQPKCTLLIVRISYGGFGATNDTVMTNTMALGVLLVNNSEDTVRFAYSRCLDPMYFSIDNPNMVLANVDSDCGSQHQDMVVIPPHGYLPRDLMFAYRKETKDIFKFKISFHLLVWNDKYKTSQPDESAIAQASVVSSDEQTFSADLSYRREETPDKDKQLSRIIYDTLTTKQKRDYILKVDNLHVVPGSGSQYSGPVGIRILFKLINNSNDTLEYMDMSCDWELVFCSNNAGINIPIESSCDKNAPITIQVPPHTEKSFNIFAFYNPALTKSGTRFKLGMIPMKYRNYIQLDYIFDYLRFLADSPKYTIWSDEVDVPLKNSPAHGNPKKKKK